MMALGKYYSPIGRAAVLVGLHFRKRALAVVWRAGHTQSQHATWKGGGGVQVLCDGGWTRAVREEKGYGVVVG